MYKKTDPQQSLFGVETQLAASLRTRLQDSWAQLFRLEILPILLKSEDQFAMLYGKTGRPNFSVARMLGLCFLQELNSMSDQQALDTFGFNTRWRYALDVCDEDAYLSRRSPVEFRRRLAAQDPDMTLVRIIFEGISKSAIKRLGPTLQSPYDPDASYGHKGKGYSAHITETCNNKGQCEIITDFEVHGAARSDKGKATEIVNRLASANLKPETLYADGGYPSAPSALEVVTKDIEFIAPVDRARLPEDVMGRDRFEFDQAGLVVQCPKSIVP